MRGTGAAAILTGLAAATAAVAQLPRPNTVEELRVIAPKMVSELQVTAKVKCLPAERGPSPAPRIVSSFPAKGAVVRPGVLVVRVTFDQPMTCSGFFMDLPGLPNPCPERAQNMVMSYDRRTIRTLCIAGPNVTYGVRLSPGMGNDFESLDGQKLSLHELSFRTSAGPLVQTVAEALAQDPAGKPARAVP